MDTSYISSCHDWKNDKVMVWERPIKGGPRTVLFYDPPRYFYIPNDNGPHVSIFGNNLEKIVCSSKDEFTSELKRHRVLFESDIQPEARILSDKYYDRPTPIVHYAFIDIETDYSSKIGFSSPEDPYAPINAITIFQSWTNKYLTYAVPPKNWTKDIKSFDTEVQRIAVEHNIPFNVKVNLCTNETELLLHFLTDIEDADIISGWNSEFFDNPYLIGRIERVLGKKALARMCFPGAPLPEKRIVQHFGSPESTYTLYGRTHLDYKDLFKKFTFEGRTSYSLANISAEELDVPKLDYPGTLEELYNNSFEMFCVYNAHDVGTLVQLDKKFKFIDLVNQMAHENTVPFAAILGTVRYVETGIINRAHYVHKKIVPNKNKSKVKNKKVEGAVVLTPYAKLHDWLGSIDIRSLYPSIIRALNLSLETFVGQFLKEEDAWAGILNKDNNNWTLVLDDNSELTYTGNEWHGILREMNWTISAFGTVFNQDQIGIVAETLTFWFEERIRLNNEKKKYSKLAENETDPVKAAEYQRLAEHYDLLQLTKKIQLNSAYGALLNEAFRFSRRELGASVTGSGRQVTKHMCQTIAYIITGRPCELRKRYVPGTFDADGNELRKKSVDWVPKKAIQIPQKSTEPYARALRDGNIKALTELLPSKVEYDYKKNKETGEMELAPTSAIYFPVFTDTEEHADVIAYGDTDSNYFITGAKNYEDAVARADDIAKRTNATFPQFMSDAFNCTGGRENLIVALREIVAERGLFMFAKKKYTLRTVNLDGKDLQKKPKLKSMGSEIKKADTPKIIQDFLKDLMDLILTGSEYDAIEKLVNSHRGTLLGANANVLALAPAKQVNNLDEYYAEYKRTEKIRRGKMKMCPGHVRAAINYNEMVEQFEPGNTKPIKAGDKVAILYLRPNSFSIESIGFPAELERLPTWFNENFNVDMRLTEEKMIDNKISPIFEVLGYDVPTPQRTLMKSAFSF
jgi:DNA polymerase elongation subunit (family B)